MTAPLARRSRRRDRVVLVCWGERARERVVIVNSVSTIELVIIMETTACQSLIIITKNNLIPTLLHEPLVRAAKAVRYERLGR
jgi:hypothetical protein